MAEHSVLVRVTHWVNSVSFVGLVVSGIVILIAHPRLYWGETGGLGVPSLLDLPIPLTLGQTGWGRHLHFLSAWAGVINGLLYGLSGILTRHFRDDFLPAKAAVAGSYSLLQRTAYSAVVFALFPLVIVTGFAMSPAITSVVPFVVTVFGGQQSARTIHFFAAASLVMFFVGHIVMVCLAGFTDPIRSMITGSAPAGRGHS